MPLLGLRIRPRGTASRILQLKIELSLKNTILGRAADIELDLARTGITERVLTGLLGHRDFATTAAYVHLSEEAVSAAAERVGAHLNKSLGKGRPRKQKAVFPQRGRKVPFYTDPAVKRFLAGKVGLPEFCTREGVDEATFRRSVEAARRAAQHLGGRARA